MTAPALYPTSFGVNTSTAGAAPGPFLKTPVLRDGGSFTIETSVIIPTGTTTGTLAGLVPFESGARLNYSTRVYTPDLDTGSSVTASIGYIYDDSTNNTNNLTAFVTASTLTQAGGFITMSEQTGFQYVTVGNGWIVLQILGGTTTTSGTVQAEINLSYNSAAVWS